MRKVIKLNDPKSKKSVALGKTLRREIKKLYQMERKAGGIEKKKKHWGLSKEERTIGIRRSKKTR